MAPVLGRVRAGRSRHVADLSAAAADLVEGALDRNHRRTNARGPFGPEVTDVEGTRTRYVAPPAESVARAADTVRAAWVVVPKYVPDAKTVFETVTHARMLAHLADSSYNYNALGPAGFNALARLADGSTCHKLTYSSLDEALALFDELATAPHEAPGT